ncbi:pH-response regulator protein palA/Rim20p [[Candida] anglica]|uniref:PH-response regulator protein palA/Rim20p n=1 Tax=[Candida] anglica TaxID=148631 RepID=A0ABP0ELL6_9ASCO
MNSNLLAIPLRQTSEIELGNQLKDAISKDFFQSSGMFEKDTNFIDSLRKQIGSIKESEIITDDIKSTEVYYSHLKSIGRKFPDDCASFLWYDTLGYRLMGPYELKSLFVERINIVYQIGAIHSLLALKESRFTDEGLKKACSLFQTAAGSFNYILNNEEKYPEHHNTLPSDLQQNTIKALQLIMEAQAQETVWQKAVSGDLKGSVIAKLAIKTSELYEQAETQSKLSQSITLEWVNHLGIKKCHFKAAAHFRKASMDLDSFNYGDQVAQLRLASKTCNLAAKYRKYVKPIVLEDFQGLAESIENSLRVAERDNDLLYLKPVPNEEELKPLVGVSMAKPIIPEFLLQTNQTIDPLFKDLIPYIVIQSAQAYRERQDSYIREQIIQPIESLNKLLRNFIGERSLPSSIDSIQKPENLPNSIIQHSQEIISYGSFQFIDSSFAELDNLALNSKKILEGGYERLQIEQNEDETLKARHGSLHWNRPSSLEASSSLRDRLEKMKLYLRQAREGDGFIKQRYEDLKPFIDIYAGGYERLSQYIPNSTFVHLNQGLNHIIVDLRKCLNECLKIEEDRKFFINSVEMKSRENNVLQLIVNAYRSNEIDKNGNEIDENTFEETFTRHLHMFNQELAYIDESRQRQQKLEEEIEELNTIFIKEMAGNDELHGNRQAALQTLESAYASYLDLISNLNEGCKFYTDFIAKGSVVLHDCDEYVHERRIGGRNLENSLSRIQSPPPQDRGHEQDTRQPQVPTFVPAERGGAWNPSQGIKFG